MGPLLSSPEAEPPDHVRLDAARRPIDENVCVAPGISSNKIGSPNQPVRKPAASHHLATFTLKLTVLAPPAFVITNLYCPSFVGVTLTEHFGPGESSLATCAPEES